MATFRQNDIQFTATPGQLQPSGKISKKSNGDFADAGTDGVEVFVNAVEIDWNGAVLPNGDIANGSSKTINTTGDLLKLIDKMNEQIYALAAAVIAIGSKVG